MSQSTAQCTETRIVVGHSLDPDSDLSRAWDDLWTRANGHYQQSFTVCRHGWNEIASAAGLQLLCMQVWKGTRLVLAWPLVRYSKGSLRVVKPLLPSGSEANSVLVDPGDEALEHVQLAWKEVLCKSGVDFLYLPLIRVGSPLDQVLSEIPGNKADRDAAPLARLSVEDDWASYRRSLGTRSAKQMARSRRRILEMENAEFQWIDPTVHPELSIRLIDWILVEKQLWAERTEKRQTWVGTSEYSNFLRQSVTDPREVQKYMLFSITANNRPIAVKLIAICPDHIEYVIGAYTSDPQIAKLSPGALLDEYWMQIAFDTHRDVDFGTGQEAYKQFWAKGNVVPLQTRRIPLTWKGKTFLSVYYQMRSLRGKWRQWRRSSSS